MKKYLLGLFAIVLAVGFSAFTRSAKAPVNSKINQTYYVYNELMGGQQDDPGSYDTQSEPPVSCPAASTLCWFKVGEDENFSDVFRRLDKNQDGEIKADDLQLIGGENGTTVELRQ